MNKTEFKKMKEAWWPQVLADTRNEESFNVLSKWSKEIIFEYAFDYAASTDTKYEACLALYKDLANMTATITTYENNFD